MTAPGRTDSRVAVVTGAASGIGLAVKQRLIGDGMTVVGVDQRPAQDCVVQDLADAEGTSRLIDTVVDQYGRLDLLVNNAGLARHAPVDRIRMADLELMWQVNVRAVIQLTAAAFREMARLGCPGHIVNVISTAGQRAEPGQAAYCATKFAVRGFTEAAQLEGLAAGIKVTALFPAGVTTGFWNSAVTDPAGFIGSKAFLTPDDVADQVVTAINAPAGVHVESITVRHVLDADLDGIAAATRAVG
ncbi:SDR family NAD(P)-dependent oxidoreductase [Kribbella pittospori]|uniref:SDR family NAD(P)-dependent oxidoreductase n=1 Tax=Kribbella pittospori TaxID=722689 RepID=A0A4R0JXG3_9ACTN|nr:SDR family NAD(P)-dependent oxidoreductase [Kribbella pittospori]TCC51500.1 SDR family NAD(P)-dependent oxidoreductase [Kribbella pittospori]